MNELYLILGMALVTFIPRLLPALFMDRIRFPSWFQRWLKIIPYAVLGALIFPGILSIDQGQPLLGLLGGLAALLLAVWNLHITLVMLGAVFTVLLLQYIL